MYHFPLWALFLLIAVVSWDPARFHSQLCSTLKSPSILFSDFFREFQGVISGGVRHHLGGTRGSFRRHWQVILEGFRKEKPTKDLPPKTFKKVLFRLLTDLSVITFYCFLCLWSPMARLGKQIADRKCSSPLHFFRMPPDPIHYTVFFALFCFVVLGVFFQVLFQQASPT